MFGSNTGSLGLMILCCHHRATRYSSHQPAYKIFPQIQFIFKFPRQKQQDQEVEIRAFNFRAISQEFIRQTHHHCQATTIVKQRDREIEKYFYNKIIVFFFPQ